MIEWYSTLFIIIFSNAFHIRRNIVFVRQWENMYIQHIHRCAQVSIFAERIQKACLIHFCHPITNIIQFKIVHSYNWRRLFDLFQPNWHCSLFSVRCWGALLIKAVTTSLQIGMDFTSSIDLKVLNAGFQFDFRKDKFEWGIYCLSQILNHFGRVFTLSKFWCTLVGLYPWYVHGLLCN